MPLLGKNEMKPSDGMRFRVRLSAGSGIRAAGQRQAHCKTHHDQATAPIKPNECSRARLKPGREATREKGNRALDQEGERRKQAAEYQYGQGGMRWAGTDELRQKGEVEDSDLGVADVRNRAGNEKAYRRLRRSGRGLQLRGASKQQLNAEVEKVGRADELQGGEEPL